MRLQREQEPERVGDDEQHGQPEAERLGEARLRGGAVGFREDGRNEQRDRCEEQQARLQARVAAIVLLDVMLEPAVAGMPRRA